MIEYKRTKDGTWIKIMIRRNRDMSGAHADWNVDESE